jgi:hypothetical protein
LSIAGTGEDERVAFARIRFTEDEVASWEIATLPGQDPGKLKQGEIFGYPVDSGTGAYMDTAVYQELAAQMKADGSFFERLFSEMDKTYKHTRSWASFPLKQGNIVLFSSGYGDGLYASFWGMNKSGSPVVLITDFGLGK